MSLKETRKLNYDCRVMRSWRRSLTGFKKTEVHVSNDDECEHEEIRFCGSPTRHEEVMPSCVFWSAFSCYLLLRKPWDQHGTVYILCPELQRSACIGELQPGFVWWQYRWWVEWWWPADSWCKTVYNIPNQRLFSCATCLIMLLAPLA